MDLETAVVRRRMVRSFAGEPLPNGLVDRMVGAALRAPTAGNSRGTAWIALEGPEETSRYWLAATDPEWRASSRRWPGLSRAPAVAVSLYSPAAYQRRYGAPDKHPDGGGPATATWPVPYWVADAAFGVMTLLLEVTAHGFGACFLGNFRNEDSVLAAVGAPSEWRLFGAVAIGRPDGSDRRSASLDRAGPARSDRLHAGRWGGTAGPRPRERCPDPRS